MGYYVHKTLIVTGYDSEHFRRAYAKAICLFRFDNKGNETNMVSSIYGQGLNNYKTFVVVPDGSKEGWETSDFFDKKMDEMIEYLNSKDCKFSDNSSFNEWILVEYGDTGRRVLKSNCKNKF